jgi:hypothetical protein
MAQTYTLDEAAQRLGLTPEIFKKRLREEWKNSLKSFRDGSTLRFRSVDIDELARSLGQASESGLPLGEAAQPLSDSSEELVLESPAPKSKPKPGSSKKLKSNEQALYLSDDSDDIFALPASDSGVSKKKPKGDSDVRLDYSPTKKDARGKELTEEITLDLDPPSGKNSGKSSGRLVNPGSSKLTPPASAKIPGAQASGSDDGSSEFELSLDSDSDSFELQLNNDSSEEVPLGAESTKTGGGASGINLGKPSDSGVSLERKGKKKKPVEDDSDSLDFDLTLDSTGGPKSRPIPSTQMEEASSEFELTLEDSDGSASMNALAAQEQGNRDIFETDFELPTDDDSGSEVLPVDSSDTDLENSDFDLAISDADAPSDEDSASEVVMMDDDAELLDSDEGDSVLTADIEDEDKPTPSTMRRRGLKSDDDDEEDMSSAMGKRSRATDDAPMRSMPAAPPKWGILPLVMLVPTFIIAFLGLLLTLEIVRGMAGYQAPNATSSPLANSVAELFGGKAKK